MERDYTSRLTAAQSDDSMPKLTAHAYVICHAYIIGVNTFQSTIYVEKVLTSWKSTEDNHLNDLHLSIN